MFGQLVLRILFIQLQHVPVTADFGQNGSRRNTGAVGVTLDDSLGRLGQIGWAAVAIHQNIVRRNGQTGHRLLHSVHGSPQDVALVNFLRGDKNDLVAQSAGMEKLILDGRIHPARIEEMVEMAKREVDATIKAEGERAVLETNVMGLHPELIKLIGRMKYRTSYGQNVYNHSIEVAQLAGLMAAEIGVDVATAKRAGLLHDLGKAVDHEIEGSHVTIGVELARKYKESKEVIHAIHAHHNDVEPQTVIACLVQAADAISAARPGARRENLENYIKRLEKLEEVTSSFRGVEKSYAIQAGREVRIIVKPEVVSEDEMTLLARDIAKRIEDELEYHGQIKVHLLREVKVVEYAK